MIKQQSFKVQALYNFDAQDDDEISLQQGEFVTVLQTDEGFNDSWYTGMNSKGECGLFPFAYVQAQQDRPSTPDIPPQQWNVEDVAQWLLKKGFGRKFVECFRQHQVDGAALLQFDLTSLKELGVGTLDRRLRLLNQISSLKRQYRKTESVVSSIRPISFERPPSPAVDLPWSDTAEPKMQPKNRRNVIKNTIKVRSDMKCLSDVMLIPQHSLSLNIEHSGWLWKQGGHASWSWKRRYFVLKGMTLWYFKSDNGDAKPLGLIPLPSYIVSPSVNCDIIRKNYTFEARHTDARTYYFRAESRSELNGWMNAMIRSSLGLELPRQSNEYGLPRLRALKSLHDDMAQFVDFLPEKKSPVDKKIPEIVVQSREPSMVDDKSRILNKIKRMGINPLEALPSQLDRLVLVSQQEVLAWATEIMGQDVKLIQFSDSIFTYDFIKLLNSTEEVQLDLNAEYQQQHLENFELLIKIIPPKLRLNPKKLAEGDDKELLAMLRLLKDM